MLDERGLELEATGERVARAVRDATAGKTTLLACSGALSSTKAAAMAQRLRALSRLEDQVRISVGHGRIHIQPADRPLRRRIANVPGGTDRRSVFDRRVAERRKLAADDPIALAAIREHGERRSGEDRRSGGDRRRQKSPTRPRAADTTL
jgi:hypothetical protein